MEIKRTELKNALEIVKPGLATTEDIEQSSSFAFVKQRVVTYNDEISVSHPVSKMKITGAVKASELYLLLGKLKKDIITIDIKDGKELLLKSGNAKAGITLQQEVRLPIEEEVAEKGEWKKLPKNFTKNLSFALGACSKDMSSPLLTCVNVKKEGTMESSDRYRIISINLTKKMPIDTFLIPASSASQVIKLNPTKIATGKGWLHFKTEEETIISCRVFDTQQDTFPNVSHLLKVKGEKISFPDNLTEILDKADIFSNGNGKFDSVVSLKLKTGKIIIQSKSEYGWFKEDADLDYSGKTLELNVPTYLLKDILKETNSCIVGKERLLFKGENWKYVAALTISENDE